MDAEDVDRLVLNVMGRRFGDTDLDKDVDINDFNRFTLNYDPLGQHPFNGWARGNIDGDADVDLTDAMRVVLNFAADGYSLVAKDAAFTFENNLTRATWPGVIPLASPEQNSSPEHSIVLEEDTEPLTNRLGVQPNDQSIVSDDSMVTSRKRSKPVNVLRQDEIDWSIRVSR